MTTDWDDDETLLEALRTALSPPPVPAHVLDAAKAAFAWRTIDAELAALTFDSAVDDPVAAGTRAGQQARVRVMTFSSPGRSIEIEVTDDALIGQIVPADAASATVLLRGGHTAVVPIDALGCFALSPLPTEPFRLEVNGDTTTSTNWITL